MDTLGWQPENPGSTHPVEVGKDQPVFFPTVDGSENSGINSPVEGKVVYRSDFPYYLLGLFLYVFTAGCLGFLKHQHG